MKSAFARIEPYRTSPKLRVVKIASAMLSGELGIIEGSRLLRCLRHSVHSQPSDPDFAIFVTADDATAHLPVGNVRRLWDPAELAGKDDEIAQAEKEWRGYVIPSCKRLIERFAPLITD